MTDLPFPGAVATRHWTKLPDGRVRCDACPRACKQSDGQRGLCFVRAAQGGEVVLTAYGRAGGFCVDPIEKKPLNHILPGTSVLSFGTAGCNLACDFCQNWDISKARDMAAMAASATPEAIAATAARLGCRFHIRCPHATEFCSREEPQMCLIGEAHRIACHHVDKIPALSPLGVPVRSFPSSRKRTPLLSRSDRRGGSARSALPGRTSVALSRDAIVLPGRFAATPPIRADARTGGE